MTTKKVVKKTAAKKTVAKKSTKKPVAKKVSSKPQPVAVAPVVVEPQPIIEAVQPKKVKAPKRGARRCDICKQRGTKRTIFPMSFQHFGVDWAHAKCLRKRDKTNPYTPLPKPDAGTIEVDIKRCGINPKLLAVYKDLNNVTYLRVDRTKQDATFVVCKRWQVELITMDGETADSLNLQIVKTADIQATARLLLRPVCDSVTITHRAKLALYNVLGTKEIQAMATTEVTEKFATVAATTKKPAVKKADSKPAVEEKKSTKKTAAVKTAPAKKVAGKTAKTEAPAERKMRPSLVTFKRLPNEKKDEKLPKQALIILETVQKAKGSAIATDKLFAALEGKIDTAQPIPRIYAFYRKTLIDGGFIKVTEIAA